MTEYQDWMEKDRIVILPNDQIGIITSVYKLGKYRVDKIGVRPNGKRGSYLYDPKDLKPYYREFKKE